MALRSYFILYPGLHLPAQFRPGVAPPLLALQDLWEHASGCAPSLLFRVRSESDPGANLNTSDRLESCVGMVDSATRWRVVFGLAHSTIAAVQHHALRQLCASAVQFVGSRHPASISVDERMNYLGDLQKALAMEGEGAPHVFEKYVASSVARLVQCDNDVEAAQVVPFQALCPFDQDEQRNEFQARMGTLETLSGAVLMTEAYRRLAERMPVWLLAKMPALLPPGAGE